LKDLAFFAEVGIEGEGEGGYGCSREERMKMYRRSWRRRRRRRILIG